MCTYFHEHVLTGFFFHLKDHKIPNIKDNAPWSPLHGAHFLISTVKTQYNGNTYDWGSENKLLKQSYVIQHKRLFWVLFLFPW